MNQLRLWILGAALGSFAAGMVVGAAIPEVLAAGAAQPVDAESAYVRDLVARYGLSRAQERSLRLVLQHGREQELAVLTAAETAQLPPALQSRLLAVRAETRRYLRGVLDPEQRARYDRDSRPEQDR